MPPVRRETAVPMAWILATSALDPETTALSVGLRDGMAARPDRLCSQPYGVGPDVLGQGYMRWRESIALLAGETACPGLTKERGIQARF
jgi:hypothetical protein